MPRPSTVAALLLLALGCGRDRSPAAAPPFAPPARAEAAPPARLVVPERVRHAGRLVASGTLKARQSAPLATSVGGTLRRVAIARGQEVRAGALLAVLDEAAAAASRRQAEAAVAAARAQLALAEDALARASRLRAEEGVSEAQVFEARARRELAAAQLAGAAAAEEQASVHLAHHRLVAPFSGVVTRVPDGVGIAVAAGTPLVVLVSTRELVVETSLTQEEAAGLGVGTKAVVSVPATGARTEDAVVSAVVPAVDPATNRVPIEVAVPNGGGRFLPNAFARVELPRAPERDAWRVPAAALVQRDGGYAVWVAGPDARARALAVRLLAEEGDAALVTADEAWPAELRVVAAPPLGIVEGTALREAAR